MAVKTEREGEKRELGWTVVVLMMSICVSDLLLILVSLEHPGRW